MLCVTTVVFHAMFRFLFHIFKENNKEMGFLLFWHQIEECCQKIF